MERVKIAGNGEDIDGVKTVVNELDNATITVVEVTNENGAKAIGKPTGKYITVEIPPFTTDGEVLDGRLTAVSTELKRILPDGKVLVIGLGNKQITPDAFGPDAASLIIATRHISREMSERLGLGELRSVSVLSPGVLGQTGLETAEIIKGLVDTVKPDSVITIDALAANELSRLGCTVQLTNTGISPGSGVGNARAQINEENLGVPVISLGVPTVVDSMTLCTNLVGKEDEQSIRKKISVKSESDFIVTPAQVDLLIERAARFVALAVNCALQPHIPPDDLLQMIS